MRKLKREKYLTYLKVSETTMTKDETHDDVAYYNSNGLMEYYIPYFARIRINIPFEFFDQWMKVLLTIKTTEHGVNIIVNSEKYPHLAKVFFDDLQKIGNKYMLDLYNAVWKKVPVSHYKFILPNIIDDFHGEILECIKRYAKKLEERSN